MKFISVFILALTMFSQAVLADSTQLLQLIDYMAVDYGGAVNKGKVVNQTEYEEMLDFTAGIQQHINELDKTTGKTELIEQAELLASYVQHKESVDKLRQLIAVMRESIITNYQVVVIPRSQPNLKQAALLYVKQCASCHGATGSGDGPASIGMAPPPIDFNDKERYQHRTLFGLYNTITQGVEGTGMRAFHQLNDEQRWSLAFYVGSLAMKDSKINESIDVRKQPLFNLNKLTTITPHQAEELDPVNGTLMMASLRSHPELLFKSSSNLDFAKSKLDDVITAYQEGKSKLAYQYAVEAYLDGFELVEQNISTLDKSLKLDIEGRMTKLRNSIRAELPVGQIKSDIEVIHNKLDEASELLSSKSLSPEAAFGSAFFILLREGLEALLIVAALVAFLVRTKRQDGLRYIHYGWISALVIGFLTWWASLSLIDISGASREMTEGIAAMVATVVLLYVGFWMHDKTSAAKWKSFIDDNMQKALSAGTLWTLSGLSFIAVYREAFETILFYQALWIQTATNGQHMVLNGFIAATVLLAIVGWLILRYSVRLPLRQFFSVTGGLMFILAIIFAGKGIAALQEAGLIAATPLNFYRIDLLGIYPNLQGLLVQALLLLVAIVLWNKKTTN